MNLWKWEEQRMNSSGKVVSGMFASTADEKSVCDICPSKSNITFDRDV